MRVKLELLVSVDPHPDLIMLQRGENKVMNQAHSAIVLSISQPIDFTVFNLKFLKALEWVHAT